MAAPEPHNTDDKRITPGFLAQAGKGRAPGTPNRMTKQLKEMILGALDKAGGEDYLARQAEENPAAFMSLVGKVLPMTVTSDPDSPLEVRVITRVVIDPQAPTE